MLEKYIIQKEFISEEDAKKLIGLDNATIEAEMIYIAPEYLKPKCLINEYSPNLNKVAKKEKIPCTLVYNESDYDYLALRDSEILLPFLISISASAAYELMKYFVLRFFVDKKNLKIRIINKNKRDGQYRKIEIKGDAYSAIEALRILQEEDE